MGDALITRRGGGSNVTIDGIAPKEELHLTQHLAMITGGAANYETRPYIVILGNSLNDVYILIHETAKKETVMQRVIFDISGEYETYSTVPVYLYYNGSGAFLHEGNLYVWKESSLYRFNKDEGAWMLYATLPHEYVGNMCSCNGKIYALGSSQSEYAKCIYVLNDDSSWTQLTSSSDWLGYNCALIPDGRKIHVIGGSYDSTYYGRSITYDTETNTWSSIDYSAPKTTRWGYLGKKNRRCVFTQYTGSCISDAVVGWAAFDLDSETWTAMENPNNLCCISSLVSELGNVLMGLLGDSGANVRGVTLFDSEIYTKEWS